MPRLSLILCAFLALLAGNAYSSDLEPWYEKVLTQDDPNTLAYYTFTDNECFGAEEDHLNELIEGIFIRSRIKPVASLSDPLYLNVILTCLRSSDDSFVAYTVDVGFGRYNPRPAVIYDKPYGSIGYGQSMEFISSQVRENVEAALTDYLSVNFNL
ncbi:hypothetical protein [Marinobacter zhanjiangensis]|uniref:DUF302 domain-containing protein n=1 Tax=Marinobacter zhanjiangensis TaxID=578215 RepID=A0ABQ3AXS4_9GAMM|nr:hypothetical protein [Marinobacter zhanjiangensis]GGY67574.1 hypothetical protein GCM10007071_13230 [Marinobacter zhanjiangensis]